MKICNECGYQNSDESNYCSNCGSKLKNDEPSGVISCAKCGAKNNTESHFCLNCGADLSTAQKSRHRTQNSGVKTHKTVKKAHRQTNHSHNNSGKVNNGFFKKTKSVWITSAIIIGSLAVAGSFDLAFHKYPVNTTAIGELKINPAAENEINAVASEFICTCGKCTEPLTECTCDTAVEERNFIRTNILENKNTEQIVLAVKDRFGGFSPGTKLLN